MVHATTTKDTLVTEGGIMKFIIDRDITYIITMSIMVYATTTLDTLVTEGGIMEFIIDSIMEDSTYLITMSITVYNTTTMDFLVTKGGIIKPTMEHITKDLNKYSMVADVMELTSIPTMVNHITTMSITFIMPIVV